MINIKLAIELRQAGLAWQPAERDCFAIIGEEFVEQVFCLSSVASEIVMLSGRPAITFHGSTEWALDYLHTSEVIWLPSETQLRERITHLLPPMQFLELYQTADGYLCQIGQDRFLAEDAESAYALALAALLHARNDLE